MSIERDWHCQSCGVHWVADFEQHQCWRCGSDDISVEHPVTVQRSPHAELLANPNLHRRTLDVSDALRKAGLDLGKTIVTPLNIGVTREMALTAALVLGGLMTLEG